MHLATRGRHLVLRFFFKYWNASDAAYISLLTFTGQFAIRPDKKSEPKARKFRHVGMIAGGTGNDGIHSPKGLLGTLAKCILYGLQCIHSRFPGISAKTFNLNKY